MYQNLIKYKKIVPLKTHLNSRWSITRYKPWTHWGGGGNPGPKCSSIIVEDTTLIDLLPNIIQTLKGAGKVNEFID